MTFRAPARTVVRRSRDTEAAGVVIGTEGRSVYPYRYGVGLVGSRLESVRRRPPRPRPAKRSRQRQRQNTASHRESDEIDLVAEVRLAHEIGAVRFGRAPADGQATGDVVVAVALRDEVEDLPLVRASYESRAESPWCPVVDDLEILLRLAHAAAETAAPHAGATTTATPASVRTCSSPFPPPARTDHSALRRITGLGTRVYPCDY
jgi:hypothetical protein